MKFGQRTTRKEDDPNVKLMQILAKTYKRGECIVYAGTLKAGTGYPQISWRRKEFRGNRLVYILTKGPIPIGLMVCHTCDNRACINIEHLYLGTAKDNMRDCLSRRRHKTAFIEVCQRGHAFSPENTGIDKKGQRRCLKCASDNHKVYMRRLRERTKAKISG